MAQAYGKEIDTLLTNIRRHYNTDQISELEEEITDWVGHFVRHYSNEADIELEIGEFVYEGHPNAGVDIMITMMGDSDAPER